MADGVNVPCTWKHRNVILYTNQRYIPQQTQSKYSFLFRNVLSTTRTYSDERKRYLLLRRIRKACQNTTSISNYRRSWLSSVTCQSFGLEVISSRPDPTSYFYNFIQTLRGYCNSKTSGKVYSNRLNTYPKHVLCYFPHIKDLDIHSRKSLQ